MKLSLTTLILYLYSFVFCQDIKSVVYELIDLPESTSSLLGESSVQTKNARIVAISPDEIYRQIVGFSSKSSFSSDYQINLKLPLPDGKISTFRLFKNTTMSMELATKFPEIISLDGWSIDTNSLQKVKLDIGPNGLHAMIMESGKPTIFIDPFNKEDLLHYKIYRQTDLLGKEIPACELISSELQKNLEIDPNVKNMFGTCELRSYRLALAATGEYTAFHGGSISNTLAAQVTTMNRVNGIYERDLAITMILVPNNDLLISTDAGTDPYTNGNPSLMLIENQSNCDAKIGAVNYDIGHVFGMNSGGLASVGVVCTNGSKARGVSANNAPIGDPFDIDYVAHEMGHQFGANHTQNNGCNRNSATAVEPGSASTLMGYAGLCSPNVQNYSDDYFHSISLQEIGLKITSLSHTCAQKTSLNNIPPVINSTSANITIPAYTPFVLDAIASDVNGDPLTYLWEQMDNEISIQPPSPTVEFGPNFRSYAPSISSKRYFPKLEALASGGPFSWEVLSGVNRTMHFRLTVKDFHQGGGCYDYEDVTVTVDQNSGPFVVTYPSSAGIVWEGLTNKTINWNVNNTQNAPVACSNVNILLSTDGGLTYPTVLAANTPNDGTQSITVPNVLTTKARIMVQASSGHFFDISDNNFTITYSSFDYSLNTTPIFMNGCQGVDANFEVNVGSVGGFTNPVNLNVSGVPSGTIANFSSTTVIPGNTSVLTLSNTGSSQIGSYELTITANSSTGSKSNVVNFVLSGGTPDVVNLLSPANGETGLSVVTDFSWSTSTAVGASYTIEISNSGDFANLVDQASGLISTSYTTTVLATNMTYYWRVLTTTGCGQSQYSETFNFTTSSCSIYSSSDGPITIPASGTPTINSIINVPVSGSIIDVNVLNIDGTHTWISDLTIAVQSPQGTIVPLFSNICGSLDNFNLGFDEQSASSIIDCPPVNGQLYNPTGNLNNFNTEDPLGNWKLIISDGANQDGGSFQSWTLEMCINVNPACIDPSLPIVSGPDDICPGELSTIQLTSGNLNDAEQWVWYAGSCGSIPIGTGTSIDVSPSSTTQYFVRGEGGCITSGNCKMFKLNVQPNHNLIVNATICEGDSYTFPDGSIGSNTSSNVSYLNSTFGCDSTITTNLIVYPNYNITEDIAICQGSNYTYPDGMIGNSSGLHFSYLQSIHGCDSVIQTTLQVNPVYSINNSAFICQGSNYIFPDGFVGTSSQVHQSHLISSMSCDSIINTALTVYPVYSFNESKQICQGESYTYPDGSIGTTNEIHQSHLYTIHGCDSTIVTQLTVFPTFNLIESISICNGETYYYPDGSVGTTSETHVSSLLTINGCDSIITTELIVRPTYTSSETIEICDGSSYQYPDGSIGSISEIHYSNFIAINGCDSVIITNLIVHPNYLINQDVEICVGGTYTFPDGTQASSNQVHTSYLTASTGCDSTIVTNLVVVTVFNITKNVSICEGESYTYPDGSLGNSTESHLSNLVSSLGCDSNITTNLFVRPHYFFEEQIHICEGETHVYHDGSTSAVSEMHTNYLISTYGCDSTIFTELIVDPVFLINETVEICEGDIYVFPDGSSGNETQIHSSVLSTVLGCDSLVVTDLIVHPIYWDMEEVFICPGDAYVYPDGTIGSSEETHISSLFTINGCDSLISTNLNFYSSYSLTETIHICSGESHVFPDGSMGSSNSTHLSVLSTQDGCDSLITTELIVDPIYNVQQEVQICEGDYFVFPDGSSGSTPQTHFSYLLSSTGCDSIIETHLLVRLEFAFGETVNICNGESYTFPDGSFGNSSQIHVSNLISQGGCDSVITTNLVLHNASTSYQYPFICSDEVYVFPDGALGTTSGPHTSYLTSVFGCDSTIVSNLSVIDINASVTIDAHTLSAAQIADAYQWLDCDLGMVPIIGETNREFTPSVEVGNFAVRITLGSCTETSICLPFDVSGLDDITTKSHLLIFPNPTRDILNIQWSDDKTIESVRLYDVQGKLILEQQILHQNKTQFSLATVERGTYFLRVNNSGEVFQIVKN